ncbi:DUF3007 family protein [Synechococcus sp. Nb3U1]|uniref:DUF3007 family protein n=1 Tax=Synechococcus sp. Nb3U1 TaxID=1914529 RepID=UPI001F3B7C67|nr:DUF3007 family protein [Synechococcus sp. Nb3U1]MCF2970464.1 DUF3007 family protein [Synechococcus sp. Nb3U1]
MRRLDVLNLGLAVLLGGGLLYGALLWAGLDTGSAQKVSSVVFLLACLGWTFGYLGRVLRGEMALKAQRASFEVQQMQERLEALSPEEWQTLQAELEKLEKEGSPAVGSPEQEQA